MEGKESWESRLRTYLRVKAKVNLLEPLKTSFFTNVNDEIPAWIPFKYKKMADFCYDCGKLGQGDKNCTKKKDNICGPLDH